ncbi:hypothetical protein GCM10027446_09000 [Angustibacter peucedani]
MTTLDPRPPASAERPRTVVQRLASAYAERLSLLRVGADDDELAESASLIAALERQHQRTGRGVVVDVRDDALRTTPRPDPTTYLG